MSLKNCSKSPHGFALIAVLWLLILLSLIAMQISSVTRSEAQLARNMTVGSQVQHAAESGVRWAIWSLTLPQEERWLADGSVQKMEFDRTDIAVSLQDENGKIDINMITPAHLAKLFEVAEVDEEIATPLVDAILDWRDEDDLKRLNGAEDEDYLDAGYEYGAKDGIFESVEELQKVLGMEPWIYNAISPALTVYSLKNGINPLVAPRLVLLSLEGADEYIVDQYIEDRRLNHEDRLPPPETPPLQGKFISPSLQGVYYTIYTEAVAGQYGKAFKQVVVRRRSAAANARFDLIKSSEKKEPLFIGLESDD